MTCDIINGRPTIIKQVTWKKGNKALPTSSHYKLSDKGKVLTISSLSHTLDDGSYSCAAENDVGMGFFSAKFQLLVNCKCALILREISMSVTLIALVIYVVPTYFVKSLMIHFCMTQQKVYKKD